MIGPVLHLELLLGTRRGRLDYWRRLYCGWLILQFLLFFGYYLFRIWRSMMPPPDGDGRLDPDLTFQFTSSYAWTLVVQHYVLLFLLTPAFVAGAITDEKSSGTLQYLLTTSLSTWEIVIGKLLGRLAQLALLALAALPLLCWVGPFTGFNPIAILAMMAFTVLGLVALGSVSVLVSVWSRQTRDAVIAVYGLGLSAFLLVWGAGELAAYLDGSPTPGTVPGQLGSLMAEVDGLFAYADPRFVLAPADAIDPNLPELGRRLSRSAWLCGGFAALCLAVAVGRLRRAYIRQLEGVGVAKKVRWWSVRRTADEEEPIRWKERQVEGIAPLPALRRIPTWLGVAAVGALTLVVSLSHLVTDRMPLDTTRSLIADGEWGRVAALVADSPQTEDAFWYQALALIVLASLVVGVRSSGSISGERERQTWEALLLTPLPIRELVRGKLFGIIGSTLPYLVAYLVPAVVVSWVAGGTALCWTVMGALLLWPAMYFVGAVGMWYSVSSRSSWKSFLATLGVGYAGGFIIAVFSLPVVLALSCVLFSLLHLVGLSPTIGRASEFLLYLTPCLVLGWFWLFRRLAESYVLRAQKWLEGRERTPYWKSGVNCGLFVELYMARWENKNA